MNRPHFFICGKCFKKKGDGPFTSSAEYWIPGTDTGGQFHPEVVPINAICEDCGHRAWPID